MGRCLRGILHAQSKHSMAMCNHMATRDGVAMDDIFPPNARIVGPIDSAGDI